MNMRPYHYAIIATLVSGVGYAWQRVGNFEFEISLNYSDLEEKKEEDEYSLKIFDCPECGLPGEIAGMAMDIQEGGIATPCYIVNCFGEHNMVAVTTQWLEENALEQR